jgi:hypothetical protein
MNLVFLQKTLSMQRNPYHMHMHFRNSFSDFIRRPMALVDTYNLSSSPDLLKQHNNQQDEKAEEREGGGLTTTTPGMATQQQRQQQQHSQRPQLEFNHRPLAHNLSTNPKDELPKYSDGSYCSMPLPSPDLHWQYDLFCPEAPEHLPEYSPPFYELNPDTERPFANIIRMRSAKIKNFKNMQVTLLFQQKKKVATTLLVHSFMGSSLEPSCPLSPPILDVLTVASFRIKSCSSSSSSSSSTSNQPSNQSI